MGTLCEVILLRKSHTIIYTATYTHWKQNNEILNQEFGNNIRSRYVLWIEIELKKWIGRNFYNFSWEKWNYLDIIAKITTKNKVKITVWLFFFCINFYYNLKIVSFFSYKILRKNLLHNIHIFQSTNTDAENGWFSIEKSISRSFLKIRSSNWNIYYWFLWKQYDEPDLYAHMLWKFR